MRVSFRNTFLTAFITFTLISCMSNGKRTSPDQMAAPVTMNSIVFVDHSLNNTTTTNIFGYEYFTQNIRVSVQRSGIKPSDTGLAEVWVMLKNHSSSAVQLEGRVQFFDQAKSPSENMSAWQRVYVPANSTVVYKELAINRSSSYYQIEFREGS